MAVQAEIGIIKKFSGTVIIAGTLSMLTGAAFWGASETDLWQSLANGKMEEYLVQVEGKKDILVVNTIFWTLGVMLLGIGVIFMSDSFISRYRLARVAKELVRIAIPVAIVSFIVMLSLAIHPPTIESAMAIGWIGARLDDLATILIIGACPVFLSVAGRNDWIPGWLTIWGYLAGIAGLLGILSLLTGIVVLGFVIIPFGLGWMLAAGLVLIRKSKDSQLYSLD